MTKRSSKGSSSKKILFFFVIPVIVLALIIAIGILKQQRNLTSEAYEVARTTGLYASPSVTRPYGSVKVIWYAMNPTANDWIGLYMSGSSDTAILARKNLKDCAIETLQSGIGGYCPFTLPGKEGIYEFRLFRQTVRIAVSNKVRVLYGVTPTPPISLPVWPSTYPTVSPVLSCYPPPPCVYREPLCDIPEPLPGWCPIPAQTTVQ